MTIGKRDEEGGIAQLEAHLTISCLHLQTSIAIVEVEAHEVQRRISQGTNRGLRHVPQEEMEIAKTTRVVDEEKMPRSNGNHRSQYRQNYDKHMQEVKQHIITSLRCCLRNIWKFPDGPNTLSNSIYNPANILSQPTVQSIDSASGN